MEQILSTPRSHLSGTRSLDTLSQLVDSARDLCQERNRTAQRCGCGRRCVSCRTSLTAAWALLRRALVELDSAQDQLEHHLSGVLRP